MTILRIFTRLLPKAHRTKTCIKLQKTQAWTKVSDKQSILQTTRNPAGLNAQNVGYKSADEVITFAGDEGAEAYAKNWALEGLRAKTPIENLAIIEKNKVLEKTRGTADGVDLTYKAIYGFQNRKVNLVHGHPINAPISIGDYQTINNIDHFSQIKAYNIKGEYSLLEKKSGYKKLESLEVQKKQKHYFSYFQDMLPLPVHNLQKEIVNEIAKKPIYAFFPSQNLRQKQAQLDDALACAQKSNQGIMRIHKFLKENADKMGVVYRTNYSGLANKSADGVLTFASDQDAKAYAKILAKINSKQPKMQAWMKAGDKQNVLQTTRNPAGLNPQNVGYKSADEVITFAGDEGAEAYAKNWALKGIHAKNPVENFAIIKNNKVLHQNKGTSEAFQITPEIMQNMMKHKNLKIIHGHPSVPLEHNLATPVSILDMFCITKNGCFSEIKAYNAKGEFSLLKKTSGFKNLTDDKTAFIFDNYISNINNMLSKEARSSAERLRTLTAKNPNYELTAQDVSEINKFSIEFSNFESSKKGIDFIHRFMQKYAPENGLEYQTDFSHFV